MISRFLVLCVLLAQFSAPGYGSASAAETVVIGDTGVEYPLGSRLDYLEDSSGELTINQVASPEYDNRFTVSKSDSLNFGFTSSAYWLRVRVANPRGEPLDAVLESAFTMLDLVEVYTPSDSGGYVRKRAGDTLPLGEREIKHIHFVFNVTLPPGQTTLYVRIKTREAMIVPLSLWPGKTFNMHDNMLWLFYGIYFGSLSLMVLYNFFIFFSLREKSYLVYVIYIFSWILVGLTYNGFSNVYLWTDSPWWTNRFIAVSAMNVQFWGVVFTRLFLNTAKTVPRVDKVMVGYMWFCVIFGLGAIVIPDYALVIKILVPTALVYPPLVLAAGFICWIKRQPAARYFLLAWICIIGGIINYGLVHLGVAPLSFITFHSMDIGVIIEATLLSLALADKINVMRKEKEKAQRQVHETLTQAKQELEAKVAERTVELKAANESLLEAKDRAEEATKLKDKFVSLVSHDLLSPLGSVRNMLQLVQDPEKYNMTTGQREDFIARAEDTSTRLITFIEGLLDISRLQTGKITPQKKFIVARTYVDMYIANISYLAESKGVEIVNNLDNGMRLFADPALFGEVIHNLISNAIKFTSQGDVITVYAPSGSENTIAVKDTGQGIGEKVLADIFKHEVKTSTTGTAGEEGTGLGLPYCHDIMKAHGGELTVESSSSEGSVFHIRLPEARTLIMLVDDQEAHRLMMKGLIAKVTEETEIIEANNGKEALEILKDVTPHLIVTDIMMPELDGFEFLKTIKKNPMLETVHVIVATSDASSSNSAEIDVRQTAFALGADDFVTKPVSAKEFIPRIKRFLG